jgi:hypothetical protein
MDTAPALQAEIAQLRQAGFRRIHVDLRGNPTVHRVFEVTGTSEVLPFTDA